jgi:hypothetical protein
VAGDGAAASGDGAAVAEAMSEFPAVASAAREARHFVINTLRSWGQERFLGDAAIVTAELAANAILHACSAFTVVVSQSAGYLTIAVKDSSPMLPATGGSQLPVSDGHGLAVVAKIARRWAVDTTPQGKVVWAELSPPGDDELW